MDHSDDASKPVRRSLVDVSAVIGVPGLGVDLHVLLVQREALMAENLVFLVEFLGREASKEAVFIGIMYGVVTHTC